MAYKARDNRSKWFPFGLVPTCLPATGLPRLASRMVIFRLKDRFRTDRGFSRLRPECLHLVSRLSGESRNDGLFGEAAASSNGGAASAGEAVAAVGASDAFDDAELAQTGELSGEGGGRALGEQRPEVGAAQAGDVEAGTRAGSVRCG
jgi:hypothetical protein